MIVFCLLVESTRFRVLGLHSRRHLSLHVWQTPFQPANNSSIFPQCLDPRMLRSRGGRRALIEHLRQVRVGTREIVRCCIQDCDRSDRRDQNSNTTATPMPLALEQVFAIGTRSNTKVLTYNEVLYNTFLQLVLLRGLRQCGRRAVSLKAPKAPLATPRTDSSAS